MRRLSIDEVAKLTGFPELGLRLWLKADIIRSAGEFTEGSEEVTVFEPQVAFALYVGSCYRREKAPAVRVEGIVKFLAGVPLDKVQLEIAEGRTVPVPAVLVNKAAAATGKTVPIDWRPGMFTRPDYGHPSLSLSTMILMRRLDLAQLWNEFVAKVPT